MQDCKSVYAGSIPTRASIYRRIRVAKPNYNFEKRQKELARKKKKEEKRLRKMRVDDNQSKETQPMSENDDNSVPTSDL